VIDECIIHILHDQCVSKEVKTTIQMCAKELDKSNLTSNLTPKGPKANVQAFLEVWAGHCEGHIYQKFMN
jgi:hypothetical protein